MREYLHKKLLDYNSKLTFEELIEIQEHILELYEELEIDTLVNVKGLITRCNKENYRLIIQELEEIE